MLASTLLVFSMMCSWGFGVHRDPDGTARARGRAAPGRAGGDGPRSSAGRPGAQVPSLLAAVRTVVVRDRHRGAGRVRVRRRTGQQGPVVEADAVVEVA